MAFNSAIIIKPKKIKGADKVKHSSLHGVEEFMPKEEVETSEKAESYSKGKKFETSEKVKETALNSINPIKPSKFEGSYSPKSEDMVSIDLMLSGSKKPSQESNAYDKEAGEFKVEKDEEGIFKESGESAKKKYLEKLKSRKGM
jgi:hypothetical protein